MRNRIEEIVRQAEFRHPRHQAVAVPEIVMRQDAFNLFATMLIKEAAHIAAEHTFQCSGVTYGVEQVVLNHFNIK